VIRGVIALLEDAHQSELRLVKERIIECREAWDDWRAGGESSTGGSVAGAEECVLRGRYELAKARVLHFGAFEFRPEWKRTEGDGRTEDSPGPRMLLELGRT
jgi:hypothetical protein